MGKYVKVPVEFANKLVEYLSTKPIREAKGFFDGLVAMPVCEDVAVKTGKDIEVEEVVED